jgi:outer membrane protein assembly factor BamB
MRGSAPRAGFCLVAAAGAALAAAPSPAPWPMMFADRLHTNIGPSKGPSSTPRVLWSYMLPLSYGLAVGKDAAGTGDDVVYVTTDGDPAPNGGIHAILSTGKPLWQWVSPDGGYMDCVPALGAYDATGEGSIFVGETNLHAVSTSSGADVWDVPIDSRAPFVSSPVLGPDGTSYFITGSFTLEALVYAVAPNGTVRWSIYLGILPENVHTPPALSSPGDAVYFYWAGQLHALSAEDGTELWAASVGAVECSPSVGPDATVFCGTAAFAPSTGLLQWAIPQSSPQAAAYVAPADGNKVYGVGADGAVRAYASADGSVRWTARMGSGANATGAFVLDSAGSLFVRDTSGRVLSLSRGTGNVQWTLALPGGGRGPVNAPIPWPGGAAMMSDGTLLFVLWNQTSTVYAVG